MAFSPSSEFDISTKPKPRERPVSRSVKMLTRSTCPYASNSWRNSSSEVLKLRLPTKMFFKEPLFLSLRTGANTAADRKLFYRDSQTRREYSKFCDLGKHGMRIGLRRTSRKCLLTYNNDSA